jgi:2-haloacid dehalogenase
MRSKPKAICFDAYGTLFDVYSVGRLAESFFPGKGSALALMWRDKQVEYTRLRSMSGHYKPFWDITRDALEYCCEALGLNPGASQTETLMGQYARLSAFPENREALQRMRSAGFPLAILTNGNPGMIGQAVESAGMSGLFATVLSADQVRRYKVDASVYQLATDFFACEPAEVLFVSSNGWDVCGAAWYGFTTFWVNRSNAPAEVLDVSPAHVGSSLAEVADLVCGRSVSRE